ncbi:MAG: alpha/beta hydrolase, partial [Dehalococcoidales bacterium]
MPRLVKIILRVVLGLIVLYVALCAIGAVLAMRIPRLPLKGSPASAGLAYTDVSFPSRNSNFTLEGWFIPGAGNKTIIIVHGGFQNRLDDNVDTVDLTKSLVADGYNVLLFDLRGRGESQGTGLNILTNEDDIG